MNKNLFVSVNIPLSRNEMIGVDIMMPKKMYDHFGLDLDFVQIKDTMKQRQDIEKSQTSD